MLDVLRKAQHYVIHHDGSQQNCDNRNGANVMAAKEIRKQDIGNEWVSLVEASKMLGLSRQTVLTLAVKGELEAQHIAGRTVVSRKSVERALSAV